MLLQFLLEYPAPFFVALSRCKNTLCAASLFELIRNRKRARANACCRPELLKKHRRPMRQGAEPLCRKAAVKPKMGAFGVPILALLHPSFRCVSALFSSAACKDTGGPYRTSARICVHVSQFKTYQEYHNVYRAAGFCLMCVLWPLRHGHSVPSCTPGHRCELVCSHTRAQMYRHQKKSENQRNQTLNLKS